MAAQLDDLRERLQQAEQATEDSHRQTAVLQVKLDDALKEQGILEESVHEHTERIEEMDNERRETLRARRELELIYEYERSAAMKEREEVQAREEELQGTIQRLKETLTQRDLRAGLDDERRPSMSRNCKWPNRFPEASSAANILQQAFETARHHRIPKVPANSHHRLLSREVTLAAALSW